MGFPWRLTGAPGEAGPSRKRRLTPEERTVLQLRRLKRQIEDMNERLLKVEALAQGTADELERPLSPEEVRSLMEDQENDI